MEKYIPVAALAISLSTFLLSLRTQRRAAYQSAMDRLEARVEELEADVARYKQRVEDLEGENVRLLRRLLAP